MIAGRCVIVLAIVERMDVLSDVIAALRTGRPHSARSERQGPWAVTHPRFAGAGFHVLLQGSCWLIPAEAAPIKLSPGDVVFFRSGIGHTLTDDPATAPPPAEGAPLSMVDSSLAAGPATTVLLCGAYQFDRHRSHPLLETLPEVIHLPTRVGRHRSLRAAVELLGDELEQGRPGADAVLPSLLDVLLLYVVRAWYDDQEDQPDAPPWATALHDGAISTALREIHDDPGHPWTVQALGQRAGLSRAAFARRFTELVGQPPLAYLTWWRMTLAAGMLRERDAPLGALSRQLGYTSEYAFAAAFKRAHGIAPGRYRLASRRVAG
jgi:AraC-like DNA-binding protein